MSRSSTWSSLPTLLLEIGCEELPASACREAAEQLPKLCELWLDEAPTAVYVGPRRLAVVVEELPDPRTPVWLKGPPVSAPEQAREGFARRHGVTPDKLEKRGGFLGAN